MRIIETVQVLKRKISLHGAKGVLLNDAISDIGEGEEISWLLITVIIRRYLSKHDYKFKLTDNQPIDIDSWTNEELLHHRDSLVCVATSVDIHRAFGIETSVDIQQPGSTNESVLEMVVRSGSKGCLISDTAKLSSGPSTGTHIDRLVSTGLLLKRTIMPLKNVASKRALCRSVIVHSKFFSKAYDAASDGVKIMVHKTYLEQIVKEIAMIMDRNSINCLPVADLSGLMGLTSTDMYNIRKAVTSLNNKEFCGLHFSFKLCNPFYRGSSLRPACRARCISRVNSDTNQVDYTCFKARRNLPVLESVAVTLDQVQDGLTSDQLRKIIPCNNFKRANKIFFDFNKIFSYPLEKIQDGKQLKYRLMSKNSIDASTANVEKSTVNGDGSRVKPSRSGVDKVDCTTSDIVHDDDDDDERHTCWPPVNAKKTGGSSSRKRVSMKETNSGLVSLQQQWNCKIVMDFLNKDEIGGICSVLDIVVEIRKQHIESGQTHICDKRTIIRVLDRLEQVEGKISRFEVPDPRGSKPPLVVVVLIDLKVTNDVVNAFFNRLTIKSKPVESIEKKRQHDEEEVDGFDVDETATTQSAHSRKRHKKRVDKLDDPELFATSVSNTSGLTPSPPGFCVSCMLLHHYLLQYLQRDKKIASGSKSSVSSSICINMTDMLLDLPLLYLWKTDRVLSAEEDAGFLTTCPEYAELFRDSLNDGSTLRQFLPKESSFETKPLLTFMTNNAFMRFEQSKRLCFLVSVGILKLVDLLPVKTFLSAFQSGVIRNIMSEINADVDELIVSEGIGIYGTNKLQMYLLAKLFEYLSTCEGSSSDSSEVHALVDFLFSSKYQVNIIPVGSRSKVCSSTDIYSHWKKVVLPALSFRWDDVDMQWLSLIGLQALYHSFIIGTCNNVDKESFNRTDLKDTAMMHLTTVAAWGDKNITTAWKGILVLSWKHLSVGYDAEDKDIICMQIESSDMPCEDSKQNEVRELLPTPDHGVESVECGEVQRITDEINDRNDVVGVVEPIALIDIQSPPANNCFSFGDDLVRDLKSCLIPCEDDLSSRQIAILLEVFVICYLVKYRSGVYQSLSKEAKDTLRLVQSEFVDPASSCLDVVDLQFTDFSMVPDALISNTLSKLMVRKNVVRNRINQCLRTMPALNELVGWVICRKGSALSYTFIDQLNHVLESRSISMMHARRKKTIHKALSLIIQSCFETFTNKKKIISLLQERYAKEHVKAAYQELLARGLIRRRKVCDYPGCQPGKASRCKHKNYETTQLFIDMFSFSLAPLYAKLLKGSRNSDASVVPKIGPTFFHRLAANSHPSSSFENIVPAYIAYICNVMSSAVEAVQSGIDLSSCAADGTCSSHNSSSTDLLTNGRDDTAVSSLLELLPKKDLFTSSNTTFCQKPLNSIRVQLQVETGRDFTCRANEDVHAEEAPSQTLRPPWRLFDGTLNHVVFEQFAAKTLAIITERPGTTFRHIHTHLQILSESQSLELLALLSDRRLTMYSYSAKEVIVKSPFEVHMKFTNTVDKRTSLQDKIQDRCYFLRMDS